MKKTVFIEAFADKETWINNIMISAYEEYLEEFENEN